MTDPVAITFAPLDLDALATVEGRVAILVEAEGRMNASARKVDQLTRKAVSRLAASPGWAKAKVGEATLLSFPSGVTAEGVVVVKSPRKPSAAEARTIGAALARMRGPGPLTVAAGAFPHTEELAMALTLRAYDFAAHKTAPKDPVGPVTIIVDDPEAVRARLGAFDAVASGVFFTRDLVNEPANVLTTTEFAHRLEGLRELGLEVEVLE
jgi:leucyl aminopeptidase